MGGFSREWSQLVASLALVNLASVAHADLQNPYVVEDGTPQFFGDSGIVDGHNGLENYKSSYVGQYLNFSFTTTHAATTFASYPPALFITKSDPRAGYTPTDILAQGRFSPNVSAESAAPIDWYSVEIQFNGGGYTVSTKRSDGSLWKQGATSISGISSSSWASLYNEYPLGGLDDNPLSMAFTPLPVVSSQRPIAPSIYAFVPLGIEYATAINAAGSVVGYNSTGSSQNAAVWQSGKLTTLPIPEGGRFSRAFDINDAGTIAGSVGSATRIDAVTWDGSQPGVPPRQLSSLGGDGGWAYAVNNAGRVAGYSYVSSDAYLPASWIANDPIPLTQLSPATAGTFARGISNTGIVVGRSFDESGKLHATAWYGTSPVDLDKERPTVQSEAFAVNDAGIVVGNSVDEGSVYATYWNAAKPSRLAANGAEASVAFGVNNYGQIVGTGVFQNDGHRALLWSDEHAEAVDLNARIPQAVRDIATVTEAVGINENGWIAANSTTGGALLIPLQDVDPKTNPGFSARATTLRILESGNRVQSEIDPSLPTYVITHGWQPTGNYSAPGWDFSKRLMPKGQFDIADGIASRLAEANLGQANVILFEWEGAYTGGDGINLQLEDGFPFLGIDKDNASRRARLNAEYAGAILGRVLHDDLGGQKMGDLQFIGHSYGNIVNGLAARFLGSSDSLTSEAKIQFTILDAPTDAPGDYAPNFDKDWFYRNLPGQVDFVDNYYSSLFAAEDYFLAYGEPLEGAQINQEVPFAHARQELPGGEAIPGIFTEFYPGLVRNGLTIVRDGGLSVTNLDWISPPLTSSYGEHTFVPSSEGERIALGNNFVAGLGAPVLVDHLPWATAYQFLGILLPEQSPVSALEILEVPLSAKFLSFEWAVGEGGDGDWITLYFGENLLWTMSIDEALAGSIYKAEVDISQFAGLTNVLAFSLNNVGAKNAKFYIGNLELQQSVATVPIPSSIFMFVATIISMLAIAPRKRPLLGDLQ